MKNYKCVYLAGPDVFRTNSKEHFNGLKSICEEYNLVGHSPIDDQATLSSLSIFSNNIKIIDKCDYVIANLNYFRGHCVDDGTAWEIGYAFSKGKIIYGYIDAPQKSIIDRVSDDWESFLNSGFPIVEDFNNPVNLMLYHSIILSGGYIFCTFDECCKDICENENKIVVSNGSSDLS